MAKRAYLLAIFDLNIKLADKVRTLFYQNPSESLSSSFLGDVDV